MLDALARGRPPRLRSLMRSPWRRSERQSGLHGWDAGGMRCLTAVEVALACWWLGRALLRVLGRLEGPLI